MQSLMSLSGFGGFASSVHFQRQAPSQAHRQHQKKQKKLQKQHQNQHQKQDSSQHANTILQKSNTTSSPPAVIAMDVSASIQPVTPPQKRAHEAMQSASSRQDETYTAPPMLMRHLTDTESQEVEISGKTVYYIPKHRYTHRGENNDGFDDSTGRYLTQTFDHFDFRYEIKSKLGMGAFGDCYKVFDHKTQQVCSQSDSESTSIQSARFN